MKNGRLKVWSRGIKVPKTTIHNLYSSSEPNCEYIIIYNTAVNELKECSIIIFIVFLQLKECMM